MKANRARYEEIDRLLHKLVTSRHNIDSIAVVVKTKSGNQYVQSIGKTMLLEAGK